MIKETQKIKTVIISLDANAAAGRYDKEITLPTSTHPHIKDVYVTAIEKGGDASMALGFSIDGKVVIDPLNIDYWVGSTSVKSADRKVPLNFSEMHGIAISALIDTRSQLNASGGKIELAFVLDSKPCH